MRLPAYLLSGSLAVAVHGAPESISFNTHIRPILADNCFACHGADAAHREAKLRLDEPESAFAERNGARAIVPGKPDESEVWLRIISPHGDEVMPPPESHKKPLDQTQRNLIRRWIEEGAVYQKHWAYEPIVASVPPSASGEEKHPIDRWVAEKLTAHKLPFAPEAEPEVLFRRLALDLTGLPPAPGEIDVYLAAPAATRYEHAIERLLGSVHYGEHFGRHWLDAVRYADTHGLHLDNVRTIWPYRDWVVRAFNQNLPFDRFTIEQLAGDMLPNPSIDQRVASGYNRNLLTTSEAGAIEEESEMRNTADRIDTTAAVWMGMTANCASCHDHKFDPLTQREYYAMGAIFKGLADRVWDGNVRLPPPIVTIGPDAKTQARIDEIEAQIPSLEAAVRRRATQFSTDLQLERGKARKPITYEVVWADDSDLPTPENVKGPTLPGDWEAGANVISGHRALRLDGSVARPIAFAGGELHLVVRSEATFSVHLYPDRINPPRAVSLQLISDEKVRRLVWGDPAAFAAGPASLHMGPLPAPGAFASLEFSACDAGLSSGKKYSGIMLAQSDGIVWWDRVAAVYTSPTADEDPLLSFRPWVRSLREAARTAGALPVPHNLNFLVSLSEGLQKPDERERLQDWYRNFIYGPLRGALESEVHAARRLMAEQLYYEQKYPATLVSRELPEPLPAHVLIRGQYDKPGERVEPDTPAFLPAIDTGGKRVTRLDFARWLVSPKHPLTARVTVNRIWLQLFGQGLVRTPADFGLQGAPPTHPELLDWLAGEFMRSGWDVKRLVRLIVTSRTYRQSSRFTPELLALDPENRLLARASRNRLDAEVLRDQALAIGGLLVAEMGGPPVKPYQPSNVWEPVAFGDSNTKAYVRDHGTALYRRSIYSFLKRTAPAPAMATFDAPSRENYCLGRNRSNTPLQALALMNDVQQFEAARGLAERLLRRTSSEHERLAYAFRCVTGRAPTDAETTLLAETLATHRAHCAKDTEAASRVIANGESKPNPALPVVEFAAWTMVANLLLNLDETIVRN